jgi:hypothetical protein
MAPPRRSPPLWFLLCVAAALAGVVRLLSPAASVLDGAPGHVSAPAVAFLGFLILLGELIWKGLEVAGKITLTVLHWLVINLSLVVTKIGNGLKALGSGLLVAAKRTWEFTRKLYDEVLKPAWQKFWKWFDKFRAWLDRTFRPVLRWLKFVRDNFLKFYKTVIRPWLDIIDVTRKLLRVLATLHVPFARQLDARLGRLEELIDKPFRLVLSKINEVIGIVNRIVTLDGLLQRVALIRSLARDYLYAWRAIVQPYSRPVDAVTVDKLRKAVSATTLPEIASAYRSYLRDDSGPDAPLVVEMGDVLRIYFKRGELPTEL